MADVPWRRCRSAQTVGDACHGLTDDLLEMGYDLPSVYLLIGNRLRCQAARGYFQVVDGFPPGTGVIGRVVGSGREIFIPDVSEDPTFIAAIPGLRSEIGVPVRVDGIVVGAVNVESRTSLEVDALHAMQEAAAVLGERLASLGGLPRPSLAQRLAQISLAMTAALTPEEITETALEAAMELSELPSAAIAFLDGRPDQVIRRGRLSDVIADWGAAEIEIMRSWVSAGMSSYFPGGEDIPAAYAFLRATSIKAISVHPMVLRGDLFALLLLVSDDPVPHAPSVVEVLEMLAAQTAASLGVAELVSELSRRAEIDDLTGLGNAAVFASDLRARTASSSPHDTLVCIDVDEFKSVNDSYGHLAGDRLLQALATEMQSVLRGTDRLYRIGGDEFAALITTPGRQETDQVVSRLLDAARRVRTTVSIGTAPLAGRVPEQARRLADEMLYVAKSRGRDCAEVSA
jgi:diguanylate cyclase (GGDEF)-like protein